MSAATTKKPTSHDLQRRQRRISWIMLCCFALDVRHPVRVRRLPKLATELARTRRDWVRREGRVVQS